MMDILYNAKPTTKPSRAPLVTAASPSIIGVRWELKATAFDTKAIAALLSAAGVVIYPGTPPRHRATVDPQASAAADPRRLSIVTQASEGAPWELAWVRGKRDPDGRVIFREFAWERAVSAYHARQYAAGACSADSWDVEWPTGRAA